MQGSDVVNADWMYTTRKVRREPLLEQLRSHREWKATDPRDMVYGLLSLVVPESEAEALQPDYAMSLGQVFADTVLTTIHLYSRLSAFAYVTHPADFNGEIEETGETGEPEEPGYRSWAPRWDDPEVAEALGIWTHCPWNACGGKPITTTSINGLNPDHLCLFGIHYDTAVRVGPVMDGHYSSQVDEAVTDLARGRVQTLSSGDDFVHEEMIAVIRNMTASSFGLKYVHTMDAKAHDEYIDQCQDFIVAVQNRMGEDSNEVADKFDAAEKELRRTLLLNCSCRRFFWMQNGTFGLGPQCMRQGDIVVVLYGGNAPYLIRPRRGIHICSWGKPMWITLCKGNLSGRLKLEGCTNKSFASSRCSELIVCMSIIAAISIAPNSK